MFCVSCGTAVSGGASFCTKCGHSVSTGDSSQASGKVGDASSSVRTMNIVAAIGMALIFGALLVSKGGSMPSVMLALVLLFCFLMVGAPAATALALSNIGGRLVRRIASGLNIALIIVWIASMVQSFTHPSMQIIWNLGAALFYVLPEAINIQKLLAYEKQMSGG